MEGVVMKSGFWKGKRVFITGHTGFKGGWCVIWLRMMGAEVKGFSLGPPTNPSLFRAGRVGSGIKSVLGDVRDLAHLKTELQEFKPEIVIHMAAQSLVRQSYSDPVGTYATNVLGTVNVLESVRQAPSVRVVLVITSDKCYENIERSWGYKEGEPLGGYDPYSSSKASAEIVTAACRNSFFNPQQYPKHGVAVATGRAGNVIGGGDWAKDRLVPDILNAFSSGQAVVVRNPQSIRPWQHVLEPVSGYLLLVEKLFLDGPIFAEAWNFGPSEASEKPVSWIVEELRSLWGKGASWVKDQTSQPHEANFLRLDSSKANERLGWSPRLDLKTALRWVVEWTRAYQTGHDPRLMTESQIESYLALEKSHEIHGN